MKYIKLNSITPFLITICLILWVFLNWFSSPVTLGGDFNFVNYDQFRIYSQRPYVWDYNLNNGFGQITLFTLPFFYYSFIASSLTAFIQNPFILHKIIFLYPLLCITAISAYLLARLTVKNKWAQAIVIILYMLNPYFIMLTSGGQMGVAFAYGLAPVVFAVLLKTLLIINAASQAGTKIKWYLVSALVIAIHISFDSRLALLILLTIDLLYLANWIYSVEKRKLAWEYLTLFSLTAIIVVGFHAYWILPSLFVQSVSLPKGYATRQAVEFFSFGRLAHSLTWTHPNYPENLFGVVKEVSGVAFIIPILAFWKLRQNRKLVIYFSFLALVSAFLAKGTNEPFGGIYHWAFQHLPLFSWFRDSTKFFLPLSLCYSVLIGLAAQELFQSKLKSASKALIFTISILSIVYIWYPTLSHQVNGTLAHRNYPQEFQSLEQILKEDQSFGRVLWIPSREMYGYTDKNHPPVSLVELRNYPGCLPVFCLPLPDQPNPDKKEFTKEDLFAQIDAQTDIFTAPNTEALFQQLAINYIVISPDIDRNIYMYDQKYNAEVKNRYIQRLASVNWINPLIIDNVSAFSSRSKGNLLNGQYTMVSPTEYEVVIPSNTEKLLFNQTYDKNWNLVQGSTRVGAGQTAIGMLEFSTKDVTAGTARIQFSGQRYAYFGWTFSIVTILTTLVTIIIINLNGKRRI
ncbi:MAG: hypothetical protein M3Q44_00275 [bacterium]|nr:hypothetical protein [bacterium]